MKIRLEFHLYKSFFDSCPYSCNDAFFIRTQKKEYKENEASITIQIHLAKIDQIAPFEYTK